MSSFLSRNLVPVACVAGSLFVGYCIYFDKKRRSHPDYKKKLYEKRRQQAEAREAAKNQYPDLGDAKAVQAFLIDNMTKGDEAFGIGDFEKGIEHYTNVVAISPQPENMLSLIQQSLPPQIVIAIMQQMPETREKIFRAQKKRKSDFANSNEKEFD